MVAGSVACVASTNKGRHVRKALIMAESSAGSRGPQQARFWLDGVKATWPGPPDWIAEAIKGREGERKGVVGVRSTALPLIRRWFRASNRLFCITTAAAFPQSPGSSQRYL